jgi:hypothetical protein
VSEVGVAAHDTGLSGNAWSDALVETSAAIAPMNEITDCLINA